MEVNISDLIKVYIKVNESNCVIDVNSSVFLDDVTDWIEIDEGSGDKYSHAQSNYFDTPLINYYGTYIYKWTGTEVVKRSDEEIQADINALPIVIEQKTNNEIGETQLIIMDALATTEENRLVNEINTMEIQATIFESILAIQEVVTA